MANQKVAIIQRCDICDYSCVRKYNMDKHYLTLKHIRLTTTSKNPQNVVVPLETNHQCICGKKYKITFIMVENLDFEISYSTDYNKELSYLPAHVNLRCNDIHTVINVNEVYNNINVYIQISRFYDIFMCVKYINSIHIKKMTLYCGHFIPICDINYNDDIYYPINKVTYADAVPKNLINPYKFFRKYTIFKFTTSNRNYKIYMFL